jgi:hypothetical protein
LQRHYRQLQGLFVAFSPWVSRRYSDIAMCI